MAVQLSTTPIGIGIGAGSSTTAGPKENRSWIKSASRWLCFELHPGAQMRSQ